MGTWAHGDVTASESAMGVRTSQGSGKGVSSQDAWGMVLLEAGAAPGSARRQEQMCSGVTAGRDVSTEGGLRGWESTCPEGRGSI